MSNEWHNLEHHWNITAILQQYTWYRIILFMQVTARVIDLWRINFNLLYWLTDSGEKKTYTEEPLYNGHHWGC